MKPYSAVILLLLLPLFGCERSDTLPTSALVHDDELAADASALSKAAQNDPTVQRIIALVDAANADLEAGGSALRLDYPWLFRVGEGTDPFARLRTGARWVKAAPEYILDESDYSSDVPAAQQDAALVSSFESWNDVKRTYIQATRMPDDVGPNPDVLDGTIVGGGCVSVIDFASSIFDPATSTIQPATDILVGGWIDPDYFELCLGSENILGVTWSFTGPDMNGDRYRDLNYVEVFYNDGFDWTTENAVFLSPTAGIDIETISVHENGHALGLGHFGGPVNRQPFKLKPNGRVFNPEAVMNPFYLGGEKRSPLPTDVAGLTTLYTGHISTTN